MGKQKSEKKPIDWDAIEPHYRAGIRPLRDIAEEFKCSNVAIVKHAEKVGWTRDLNSRIRAKAADKVSAALVAEERPEKKATEERVIEVEAEVQARILLSHRRNIGRARSVALSLLEELEHQTDSRDLYEKLGELLRSPDDNGKDKLNEIYQKAMSLPSRVGSVKALSETLKNLISLERQAYKIDGMRDDDSEESAENTPLLEVARRMAFVLTAAVKTTEGGK